MVLFPLVFQAPVCTANLLYKVAKIWKKKRRHPVLYHVISVISFTYTVWGKVMFSVVCVILFTTGPYPVMHCNKLEVDRRTNFKDSIPRKDQPGKDWSGQSPCWPQSWNAPCFTSTPLHPCLGMGSTPPLSCHHPSPTLAGIAPQCQRKAIMFLLFLSALLYSLQYSNNTLSEITKKSILFDNATWFKSWMHLGFNTEKETKMG